MIVMVTHGRSAIGEFIFGSHTRKIIANSKLPVFVLH
jgi:nucleotide-binding universal stress UspA family protein